MFEGKYVKLSDDRYLIQIGDEGQLPVEIGVLVWEDVPDHERPVRYSYVLQTDGMVDVYEDIVPGLASLEGDAREQGAHKVRDVRFDAWTNAGASAQSEPCGCTDAAEAPVACGCADVSAQGRTCCCDSAAGCIVDEVKDGAASVIEAIEGFIGEISVEVKGICGRVVASPCSGTEAAGLEPETTPCCGSCSSAAPAKAESETQTDRVEAAK